MNRSTWEAGEFVSSIHATEEQMGSYPEMPSLEDRVEAEAQSRDSQSNAASTDALWQEILNSFQQLEEGRSGRNWLRTVTPISFSKEVSLLGVTSAFSRDYIDRHCGAQLSQVINQLSLGPISWRLIDEKASSSKLGDAENTPQDSGLSESHVGTGSGRSSDQRVSTSSVSPSISAKTLIPEGLRQNLTLDRFVVGKANQVAYSAAREVLRKPGSAFNPVFLHGGSGLGKTHLLQAITREFFINGERRIRYVQCEKFVQLFVRALQNRTIEQFRSEFRNLKVLAIDDVQMIAGKKSSQEELLETIDAIAQAGGQVLLACDLPPRKCQFLHQQLQNRFSAGLVVRIDPPDLETRLSILERESIRSGIMVPADVLHYIADNVRTNVRELLGSLVRLCAEVDLGGKTIDISLARTCLEPVVRDGKRIITIELIVEAVGRRWSIPPEEIYSRSRTRNTSMARNIATYLARILTTRSLAEIGSALGQRTHASASNSSRKIRELMQKDEDLRSEIDRLVRELSG